MAGNQFLLSKILLCLASFYAYYKLYEIEPMYPGLRFFTFNQRFLPCRLVESKMQLFMWISNTSNQEINHKIKLELSLSALRPSHTAALTKTITAQRERSTQNTTMLIQPIEGVPFQCSRFRSHYRGLCDRASKHVLSMISISWEGSGRT